jgi:hypothetical protein
MVKTFGKPQMAAPFATDDQPPPQPMPPSRYSEERVRSHVAFGGPEQISAAQIEAEIVAAARRKPFAYQAAGDQVVLTDEVLWPTRPDQRRPDQRPTAARSSMEDILTDEMPKGTGMRPANGYFYNANGLQQQLPPHARTAARSHISATMFGGAPTEGEAAEAAPAGRARVADSAAQRSVIDGIVYGRRRDAYELGSPVHGRRHVRGGESHMDEALAWPQPGIATDLT